MQTNAKEGAGTLKMQQLLPAINALNQQVLNEKLVLPGNKRKAEHIESSAAVAVEPAIEPAAKRSFTLEDITMAIKAESAKADARITQAVNANVNKKLRFAGVAVKGDRQGQDQRQGDRKDQREETSDGGHRGRGRGRGGRGARRGGGNSYRNGNGGGGGYKGKRECFECGSTDHIARDCPQPGQQTVAQELGATGLRGVYFENNTDASDGSQYSVSSCVASFSVPPACGIVVPHPSQAMFGHCRAQAPETNPVAAARGAAAHQDVETQARGGAHSSGCGQPAVESARPRTAGVGSLGCQRPAGGGLSSTQWGVLSLNVMGNEILAWGVTTDTLYKA